jgi:hypothetical protein
MLRKGILYIMVDGATINTRLKDEEGSTWRENKLGLFFSSTDLRTRKDGVTHDILKKEYMSFLGSAKQFKGYLLECAIRNGYGRYEKTIPVSDGASWIRNMAEELIGLLRSSRGEEVLRRLEAYKGKKLPAGVVNPYTYY